MSYCALCLPVVAILLLYSSLIFYYIYQLMARDEVSKMPK